MPNADRAQPDLPPLREVIARHGLSAKHSLGQHYLLDQNLTDRMVRTAGNLSATHVVEVGPGPGGLTRSLLKAGTAKVVAVERDRRCIPALNELRAAYPDRLEIVEGDALALDLSELVPPPRRIIANLPYNISTPLLIGWLKRIEAWQGLTVMLQKEVAERLAATAGQKAYGRLSVMAQWRCTVEIEFNVNKQAFVPPPKVTSSVATLAPREKPLAEATWNALETVVQTAFGQRRKMVRASLKPLGLDLAALGIDPTVRAEDLDIETFCTLARAYQDAKAE
ncbi:MAG: 16S rRNA (adenine(1518)-N(6)/adenine(1519)-N(6))-dimethyltransferase RsmA [Rhodospirillales bacterium]